MKIQRAMPKTAQLKMGVLLDVVKNALTAFYRWVDGETTRKFDLERKGQWKEACAMP
jgi:hypothetical protein